MPNACKAKANPYNGHRSETVCNTECGEMPEWLKGPAWKACIRITVSGVPLTAINQAAQAAFFVPKIPYHHHKYRWC